MKIPRNHYSLMRQPNISHLSVVQHKNDNMHEESITHLMCILWFSFYCTSAKKLFCFFSSAKGEKQTWNCLLCLFHAAFTPCRNYCCFETCDVLTQSVLHVEISNWDTARTHNFNQNHIIMTSPKFASRNSQQDLHISKVRSIATAKCFNLSTTSA